MNFHDSAVGTPFVDTELVFVWHCRMALMYHEYIFCACINRQLEAETIVHGGPPTTPMSNDLGGQPAGDSAACVLLGIDDVCCNGWQLASVSPTSELPVAGKDRLRRLSHIVHTGTNYQYRIRRFTLLVYVAATDHILCLCVLPAHLTRVCNSSSAVICKCICIKIKRQTTLWL